MRAALLVAVVAALLAGCGSGGAHSPAAAAAAGATARAHRSHHERTVPTTVAASAQGAHRAAHEDVPILMYHVIGFRKPTTPNAELWVFPKDFRAEMHALRDTGYHGVTLQEVWDAWHRHGLLPSKPIVISFDDGYYGQYRDALPALRAMGWPGVLNLKLDNLNDMGGPRNIRRMIAAGWEVDSHTITHPDLTTVSDSQLHYELVDSRARLRRLFRIPVNFFCYPSGRFDAHVIEAVRRAGYLAATTTETGFARPQDRYALARVRVNGTDTPASLLERLRTMAQHPDAAPVGGPGE